MIRFRMIKISVPQFALLSEEFPLGNISIKTDTKFKYAVEEECVAIEMLYDFLSDNNLFMRLELCCEFEVEHKDWEKQKSGEVIVLPKSFIEHLMVHTVGTARGILYSKTEGTPFDKIILPPMDVTKLVTEDIVIPINK